jgi:acyl-coenzyme A thioesterase 9
MMSLTDSDSETTGSGNIQELAAAQIHKGKQQQDEEIEKRNNNTKPKVEIQFKHPADSRTTIDYPFSQDDFLREAYCSPGGTMRFGKILEDLDAFAGNIAFHHVVGNTTMPMLVTAAVDRIALQEIPRLEKDQRLSGQVTWVGNSSMEIRMQIHEVNDSDNSSDGDNNTDTNTNMTKQHHWLEGYFTFVAVDPETKKPTKICPLVPETSEERALFELGALKAANKKQSRKRGIHFVGKQITEEDMKMEKQAEGLLQEAFPLLHMPSLADTDSILMTHTVLQNTLVAQPQVRNLANRIFGGFLMRRAFELAFSNAYSFGGEWPQMLEVDNITFHTPVDVGDLLQFTSRVIYSLPDGGNLGTDIAIHSKKPLIMIEVECFVMEPDIAKAHLSNRFYFTFLLPTKESCKRVLPGTLGDARRMVSRMVADEEQAGLGKGYLRAPKGILKE